MNLKMHKNYLVHDTDITERFNSYKANAQYLYIGVTTIRRKCTSEDALGSVARYKKKTTCKRTN